MAGIHYQVKSQPASGQHCPCLWAPCGPVTMLTTYPMRQVPLYSSVRNEETKTSGDTVTYPGAMIWMFVSLKMCVCWNPEPQCGIRRWDLWLVMRMEHERLVSYKRDSRGSLPPSSATWGNKQEGTAYKQVGPPQALNLSGPWSWTYQPSELWEIHLCYL